MELNKAFSARISNFLEAYAALPVPGEVPAELVIISVGAIPGRWSYRHVYNESETCYFIFRKPELTDVNLPWECADHELENLIKNYVPNFERL